MHSRFKSLIRYIIYKDFLPYCGFSFHFLDGIHGNTIDFNFDDVQFIFYFIACIFGVTSKKPSPKVMIFIKTLVY